MPDYSSILGTIGYDASSLQDYYEALADYRTKALAAKIEADKVEREVREAIESERNLRGYYDPPEVKTLRDNISYETRILNDPNVAFTLGDEEIVKRWKRVKNMQADYFGRTKRDVSVSMPISVEEALARQKTAEPAATITPPPEEIKKKPKTTLKSMQRGRSLFEAALGAPPVASVDATAVKVEIPPGFPDPVTFPEGQTATFEGAPWIIRNGQWVENK